MPRIMPNPENFQARAARAKGPHEGNGQPRGHGSGESVRPAAFIMEPVGPADVGLLTPEVDGSPLTLEAGDLDRLFDENSRLRDVIAQLEAALAESQGGPDWQQRQKEYESLLEEKSELIRDLHLKIRELEQREPARPATPDEEELLAMSEQLERDRRQLQQERQQLEQDLRTFRDDQATMTSQMREMEVQMARERAELARQRSDVQRMLEELRHELERYERDQGLNDRLGMLRQRYQEVSSRRPGNGQSGPPPPETSVSTNTPLPREGGIFRKLFGSK